jgi:hypothetical protein
MGASGNGAATRVLVIWAELKRSGTTVVSKQAIDGRARVCCCSRIASTRSRPSVQRALHTAHSTGSPLPHLHPVDTHFQLIQRRALPRTRCHQHVETHVPGYSRRIACHGMQKGGCPAASVAKRVKGQTCQKFKTCKRLPPTPVITQSVWPLHFGTVKQSEKSIRARLLYRGIRT